MTKSFILQNQEILPQNELTLSLNNGAVLYGYGLFESILIKDQVVIRLGQHLKRLKAGAKALKLPLTDSLNEKTLIKNLHTLIQKNNITHATLNLYYNAGDREQGPQYPFQFASPTLLAICHPLSDLNFKPVSLELVKSPYPRGPLDQYKTLNFLKPILDRQLVKQGDEVLIMNSKNEILEASTANVFFVKGSSLYLPSNRYVLKGLMQAQVIKLAKSLGMTVHRRKIKKEDLSQFDELFLTNAVKGIIQVNQLLNTSLKSGKVTEKLSAYLRSEYNESINPA